MKQHFKRIFTLLASAIFTISPVHAEVGETMVVSVETDSFALTETDIGSLAVGEAKTIATESGQVVDILRTPDGAEIYIDGELLDPGLVLEDVDHGVRVISKQVDITCTGDDDSECHKDVVIEVHGDGETYNYSWTAADEAVILHEDIEVTCTDDDGETRCSKHVITIGDGDDVDIDELHGEHGDARVKKVIVIKSGEEAGD
jgi:hypothetical protein